jgi:3-dehydroquinate synthase
MMIQKETGFIWSSDFRTTVRFLSGLNEFGEFLKENASGRIYAIVDSEVFRLWGKRILMEFAVLKKYWILRVKADENLKTFSTLESIWNDMMTKGLKRDDLVLVIGGGLVCDVGAFAASSYLRGIPLMLFPTTLLAQVDACLGGKTAINYKGSKNQIGSFYPAEEVLISVEMLDTLSEKEFRCGLGEVLKTGLFGDKSIKNLLVDIPFAVGSSGHTRYNWCREVVSRCLNVKGKLIEQDLRDLGLRRTLNLGHTFGHALESSSGFVLTHGEAVGLGLLVAAQITFLRGESSNLFSEIREILVSCKLPVCIPENMEIPDILSFLQKDKKSSVESRTWVLPFDWEDCKLVELTGHEERSLITDAVGALKN